MKRAILGLLYIRRRSSWKQDRRSGFRRLLGGAELEAIDKGSEAILRLYKSIQMTGSLYTHNMFRREVRAAAIGVSRNLGGNCRTTNGAIELHDSRHPSISRDKGITVFG